jgi:AraC-like DNA-binding protein
VTARTLQRRLQSEGTSFAALLDTLRGELALTYLGQERRVGEIALLLGFSDASTFHHAFKRWTGTTPERYRASPVSRDEDA